MNIGVVTSICKAQGMSSVCLKSGCVYNSPGCRLTPLSTSCIWDPMGGLSEKICKTNNVAWCPTMDGMFTDHLGTFLMNTKIHGACGFVSTDPYQTWCAHGDNYVSSEAKPLYAYCVLQIGTYTNKTRAGYVQLGESFQKVKLGFRQAVV